MLEAIKLAMCRGDIGLPIYTGTEVYKCHFSCILKIRHYLVLDFSSPANMVLQFPILNFVVLFFSALMVLQIPVLYFVVLHDLALDNCEQVSPLLEGN